MQANSMSSSASGKPVFKNGNSSGRAADLQQKKEEAEAETEAARRKEQERIKEELKSTKEELIEVKKQKKELELDEDNNLDPGCHAKQFNIINVYGRTALDFRADNGSTTDNDTTCRTWNWDPKIGSQRMVIEKLVPGDKNSAWTIRSGSRYLELRDPSSGYNQPMCYSRRSGSEALNQQWLIGHESWCPGHYWLWNQGQKCYLKLVKGEMFEDRGTFGRVTGDDDKYARWDTRCQFVMFTTRPHELYD
ncbi:unnamed protein product [Clonostachys rosea]|uniref:Ricin B lectin domain-containing protein n=1 Tax=Bionectria ochroleuca TaxID=29856 RepID=A0ABY6V0J3_BIOOC|nr:unnamed protein product [Clonostachys rosea]